MKPQPNKTTNKTSKLLYGTACDIYRVKVTLDSVKNVTLYVFRKV